MTSYAHPTPPAPLRWHDATFADAAVEAEFQRDEAAATTVYARYALALAAVLFANFIVTDWLFAPDFAPAMTLVRVVIVAALCGTVAATYLPDLQRHIQALMQAGAVTVGLGFVAIIALTPQDLLPLYLDCVILVIVGIFVVLRLGATRATIAVLLVVAALDAVYFHRGYASLQAFVVYQLMMLSAFAIGLFCNYVFERQRRIAYLGRRAAERQATTLAQALQRAAEAQLHAEQAARVKTDFVAHVSHELRTPLNAVIGFGEVLERQVFGPIGHPKYAEYARDIRESGQHLLSLINDVLDLSKIEAGRMELHCESLVPAEVARASLVLVSGLAQLRGTTVRVKVADDLPLMAGDARAIKQMLVNLLSNALKFAPAGGTVGLAARVQGAAVEFTVSDNGPGMTADQVGIALTPFGQVSGLVAQSERGTGLGLALANRLAELHGAPLQFDSGPGQGTRVSFRIPLAGAGAPAA